MIPKRLVEQLQKLFISRRFEIKGMVDPETYVCPSFVCEQLFTYLFCMEVDRLDVVPDGMIGFRIPAQRYATVRAEERIPTICCTATCGREGLQNDKRGLALEKYNVHKPVWPDEVDVYIPLWAADNDHRSCGSPNGIGPKTQTSPARRQDSFDVCRIVSCLQEAAAKNDYEQNIKDEDYANSCSEYRSASEACAAYTISHCTYLLSG